MDNRSAVHYLCTCKQLHSLYHSFPLTEAATAAQFTSIVKSAKASAASRYKSAATLWACSLTVGTLLQTAAICSGLIYPLYHPTPAVIAIAVLLFCVTLAVTIPIMRYLEPERWSWQNCCDERRGVIPILRRVRVPRIIRLAGRCRKFDLPYLQHVEELYDFSALIGLSGAGMLPSSLRMLSVQLCDIGALKPDTLPRQLRVLEMHFANEEVMQPFTLPMDLMTLIIRYKADVLKLNEPTTAVHPNSHRCGRPAITAAVA